MSTPDSITIDNTKYVKADSIQIELPKGDFAPYEIGEEYFIQTVTQYYLGQLVNITDQELVITKASWVASTGRFNEFISGSDPSENEPYNKNQLVIVGRGAIVSAVKREIFLEIA